MALIDHTRIFCFTVCFVFWASFTLAADTTSPAPINTYMWPDYRRDPGSNNLSSSLIAANIPMTYFDYITDVIVIHINGYLSFGAEYSNTEPLPSQWPFAPKILSVYWTDQLNYLTNPLPTLYISHDHSRLQSVTSENSLITYVKKVVNQSEFEPLTVFAVTWEGVRPKLKDRYPNDTATFQVVIATDSRVTYAIMDYQSVWESPELANQTYYSAAYSQGNGARPKITIPGTRTGPEVILLGTKKPNKDPYNCVQKTQSAIARLNNSLNSLPPCPCYQLQAARDQQFTVSTSSAACYQSKTLPQGGSLLQLCCYDQHGILLNYTKEALVPVSANGSDNSLREAYDICCADGSGLCRWFLLLIPRPRCVNDMSLLNTTDLPWFTNTIKEFTFNVSPTKPMTIVQNFTANVNTPVTYSVSTIFNSSHGFRLDSTGFTWNIGFGLSELRKLQYPQQLIFYLTDTHNISAAYAALVMLCLCEQLEQCKLASFPYRFFVDGFEAPGFIGFDSYVRGNVNMIMCECKGTGTGRYCEKPVNACDNCLIQQKSVCDSNPQDYCPSCPSGYKREGTQCRDETSRGGNSIYSITSAHVVLFMILSFFSSSIPLLQNSLTSHL